MTNYLPFEQLDLLAKENRRDMLRDNVRIRGVLGDTQGNIYVRGYNGNRVFVRFTSGTDANNNVQYEQVSTARVTGAPFFEYVGAPVNLGYDEDGMLEVLGADAARVEQSGTALSMAVLNTGNLQLKFVDLTDALILLSRPVSNATNPSTRVGVSQFIYDAYQQYKTFDGTPTVADKIDLASYIPSAGNWRYVQLWLDTYHATLHVTASTTQSMSSALDDTDWAECWAGRWQDWIPLQGYILQNAQLTVTHSSLDRDHRQWVNMPAEVGFPNALPCHYRIWDNRTVVSYDELSLSNYDIELQDGATLVIL